MFSKYIALYIRKAAEKIPRKQLSFAEIQFLMLLKLF